MFDKTLLKWANMVSEAFYLDGADAGVRLDPTKIEGMLKELGFTPLKRGKWKSVCAQIC